MSDPVAEWFIDLCRELFQLEQRYGYTAGEPSCHRVEITWKLHRGDRRIWVMEECAETFNVPTFLFLPPDPRHRFGLHEAVAALGTASGARGPADVGTAMTREQLRALMEFWAQFFHAHAPELLDAQEETFATVARWRGTRHDPRA